MRSLRHTDPYTGVHTSLPLQPISSPGTITVIRYLILDSPSCSHVLNTSARSTEHSPTILGSLESSAQTATWIDLFKGNRFPSPVVPFGVVEVGFPGMVDVDEEREDEGGSEERDGRARMSSVSS